MMARALVLGLLLLLPAAVTATEKVGFAWAAELAPCEGWRPMVSWANPTGRTLYVESMRIFLGVNDPGLYGQTDTHVKIRHANGSVIESLSADKYTSPTGIGDVTSLRIYRTPWKFLPEEGITIAAFCANWNPLRGPTQVMHYEITVEGYVEP